METTTKENLQKLVVAALQEAAAESRPPKSSILMKIKKVGVVIYFILGMTLAWIIAIITLLFLLPSYITKKKWERTHKEGCCVIYKNTTFGEKVASRLKEYLP